VALSGSTLESSHYPKPEGADTLGLEPRNLLLNREPLCQLSYTSLLGGAARPPGCFRSRRRPLRLGSRVVARA
jgi:hypothetical protein